QRMLCYFTSFPTLRSSDLRVFVFHERAFSSVLSTDSSQAQRSRAPRTPTTVRNNSDSTTVCLGPRPVSNRLADTSTPNGLNGLEAGTNVPASDAGSTCVSLRRSAYRTSPKAAVCGRTSHSANKAALYRSAFGTIDRNR